MKPPAAVEQVMLAMHAVLFGFNAAGAWSAIKKDIRDGQNFVDRYMLISTAHTQSWVWATLNGSNGALWLVL